MESEMGVDAVYIWTYPIRYPVCMFCPTGDYNRALHYHQCELSLSEGTGDRLGAAIAHRRIGECHCELGRYEQALTHQTNHLKISQQLGQCVP